MFSLPRLLIASIQKRASEKRLLLWLAFETDPSHNTNLPFIAFLSIYLHKSVDFLNIEVGHNYPEMA